MSHDHRTPDGERPWLFVWQELIRGARDLPLATKGVALLLATWGSVDGTDIFPGEVALAAACGVQTRQVRRHVKTLTDCGYVVLEQHGGSAKGYANRYRLAAPADLLDRVVEDEHGRPAHAPADADDAGSPDIDDRREPADVIGSPDIEGSNTGHRAPEHRTSSAGSPGVDVLPPAHDQPIPPAHDRQRGASQESDRHPSRRGRNDATTPGRPPLAVVTRSPDCEHGASHPRLCAFCRRGIHDPRPPGDPLAAAD